MVKKDELITGNLIELKEYFNKIVENSIKNTQYDIENWNTQFENTDDQLMNINTGFGIIFYPTFELVLDNKMKNVNINLTKSFVYIREENKNVLNNKKEGKNES